MEFEITHIPEYLDIKIPQKILKPKEKYELHITYDATKFSDYGVKDDYIYFTQNGKKINKKYLVRGYIKKDFSVLTKSELKNSPFLYLKKKNIYFNEFKKNPNEIDKIPILNSGKRDLEIYNIYSTKDMKVIDYPKRLKPNQSGEISIKIHNKKTRDIYRGHLKIYSNDANHFETLITIVNPKNKTAGKLHGNKDEKIVYIVSTLGGGVGSGATP